MLGQVAVEVDLLSYEVILYLSIVAIAMFATPSYELSLANRIFRLRLLFTVLFRLGVFMIEIFFRLLTLTTMRPYTVSYMWPFIPFDFKAFIDVLFRTPIPLKGTRAKFLDPKDPDK